MFNKEDLSFNNLEKEIKNKNRRRYEKIYGLLSQSNKTLTTMRFE